jgi:hypothetical protein
MAAKDVELEVVWQEGDEVIPYCLICKRILNSYKYLYPKEEAEVEIQQSIGIMNNRFQTANSSKKVKNINFKKRRQPRHTTPSKK